MESSEPGRLRSTFLLPPLKRTDWPMTLSCSASNSERGRPLEQSFDVDMERKSGYTVFFCDLTFSRRQKKPKNKINWFSKRKVAGQRHYVYGYIVPCNDNRLEPFLLSFLMVKHEKVCQRWSESFRPGVGCACKRVNRITQARWSDSILQTIETTTILIATKTLSFLWFSIVLTRRVSTSIAVWNKFFSFPVKPSVCNASMYICRL